MKREFSAGGLVFRKIDGSVKWLIRRAANNPGFKGNLGWTLPKGWIDDTDDGNNPGAVASGQKKATTEDLEKAALREVAEETGIEAKIINKLTTIKFIYSNKDGEKVMKFVTYFLMEHTRDLPQGFGFETAEIKWVTGKEIEKMLEYKSEKSILSTVNFSLK